MQQLLPLVHHPLAIPSLFLFLSVVGGLFALNAHRPFAYDGRLSIGVFFAGWLTAELPIHHLAWQIIMTAALVWAGALGGWPGWVGVAVVVISWFALWKMFVQAGRAGEVLDRALGEALGERFSEAIDPDIQKSLAVPQRKAELLLPFAVRRPGVKRVANIAYGPHGRRNHLDVYRPRDGRKGCPVLLQIHGGAWVIGDKSQQGLPLVTYMTSLGWVCVAINYRLSPRATFPDHIVDVKRAIAWVKEHIAEYGGDPDFVVLTGGSAGGHLAALAALTPNDPEYQPGFEEADTSVDACVPFYGVYDFTNRSGHGRRDMVSFLAKLVIKRPFEEAKGVFDRASPMSRVGPHAPPFLVIHGTHDTVVPVAEARLFVELLREKSREPVAYAELPGAQHAFEVFTSARTWHVIRGVARFLSHVHATRAERRSDNAPLVASSARGAQAAMMV